MEDNLNVIMMSVYSQIFYLKKHKKAYLEYYRDIKGNDIYTVMQKKKNGTVKEIAIVKIKASSFIESVILPFGDSSSFDEAYVRYVVNKINSRIEMRKTGGKIYL